jgi:hypothetical protein
MRQVPTCILTAPQKSKHRRSNIARRILFGPVYDLICVLPYLSRYPFLEMLLFCLFSSLALLALCLLLSAEEPCWFLSKSLPHETLPGLESDKDFLCSKMEKIIWCELCSEFSVLRMQLQFGGFLI